MGQQGARSHSRAASYSNQPQANPGTSGTTEKAKRYNLRLNK
ncbi:MAG: hypothetical protein RIB93_13350 [Coleofasciculus sp. D1-CHI-01]